MAKTVAGPTSDAVESAPYITVAHETDAGWVRALLDGPYDGESWAVAVSSATN
jgi:hypothetical protein